MTGCGDSFFIASRSIASFDPCGAIVGDSIPRTKSAWQEPLAAE
jgi:hypothetical protein